MLTLFYTGKTACENGEGGGFVDDFKTKTCTDKETNATVTSYECTCKKCNSLGANCQYRDLCDNEGCPNGGFKPTAISGLFMVMGLLASFMIM